MFSCEHWFKDLCSIATFCVIKFSVGQVKHEISVSNSIIHPFGELRCHWDSRERQKQKRKPTKQKNFWTYVQKLSWPHPLMTILRNSLEPSWNIFGDGQSVSPKTHIHCFTPSRIRHVITLKQFMWHLSAFSGVPGIELYIFPKLPDTLDHVTIRFCRNTHIPIIIYLAKWCRTLMLCSDSELLSLILIMVDSYAWDLQHHLWSAFNITV